MGITIRADSEPRSGEDGSPRTIGPERAATLDADTLLEELGSRPEGLTSEEAAALLKLIGPNRLPRPKGPGTLRHLADQITHFFALMLWVAAALAFVGDMPQLGVAIVIVVIVNGIFSFAQEERAARAAAALAQLLPEAATAMRDGMASRLEADSLVPGDIVLLREGDRVSADARIVMSDGLLVDNSTLTGESEPVFRDAGPVTMVSGQSDSGDLVFAGTYVASGSARAVVIATGTNTRLGGIARLTGEVVRRPTPLRIDLNRAVKVIAACAVGAGLLFFGVSLLLGTPSRDGFLFAVGVIVALVPEGLLPTLTLALAMSATRMAHRGALVRKPESVETLGATTVICSDKTGTMTTNQMTARALFAAGRLTRATGTGWAPGGTLLDDGRPLSREMAEELLPALRAAALCGDARIERAGEDGRWRCVGDPTEGALLSLARKGGVDRDAEERGAPRIREFPFDSTRRRMSTAHRLSDGRIKLLVKGSPESVLGVCSTIRAAGGSAPLDAARRADVLANVDVLASEGLRVLALARRSLDTVPATADEAEGDLELLALAGLEDPIRPEVPPAIERCRRAGIRVVMITGDHPKTAASVAERAGIEGERVLVGSELPPDDDALCEILTDPRVCVLARIAPEQKLRIAQALQVAGHVVAMTGDGVNDAPALRQADIGVAMGITGTDVAREAADLVLLDDSFAHIVEAVEEGRAAFDNIRRFLTYHLTDNVAELAPFVLWALSAGRIPLLISVLQVLALDIGTDLLPALALGAEKPKPSAMDRPPRKRSEHLLNRHLLTRAFGFLGPIEAVCSLTVAWVGAALFFGWRPWVALPAKGTEQLATLSAMVFSTIVLMQMANAFACRSTRESLWTIRPFTNRLLVGAVLVEAAALAAFLYVPLISRALGGHQLTAVEWLPLLTTPWILLAAEEARKARLRKRVPVATTAGSSRRT
jgi:magnesium-transporting ATPase (P-type)